MLWAMVIIFLIEAKKKKLEENRKAKKNQGCDRGKFMHAGHSWVGESV